MGRVGQIHPPPRRFETDSILWWFCLDPGSLLFFNLLDKKKSKFPLPTLLPFPPHTHPTLGSLFTRDPTVHFPHFPSQKAPSPLCSRDILDSLFVTSLLLGHSFQTNRIHGESVTPNFRTGFARHQSVIYILCSAQPLMPVRWLKAQRR